MHVFVCPCMSMYVYAVQTSAGRTCFNQRKTVAQLFRFAKPIEPSHRTAELSHLSIYIYAYRDRKIVDVSSICKYNYIYMYIHKHSPSQNMVLYVY